ncbi:MAG: (deoxy)nucleoside triphosphate pyrophosphohydrolase [Burkholderiaceae bacterium]
MASPAPEPVAPPQAQAVGVAQNSPQAPQRAHTEVAVGILLRDDGALLLATRPPGKPYAGYWEFPGGKIEAGETVEQALRRELHEELGIIIGPASVWRVTEHDYPHARVRLHWCKVRRWSGAFEMREGQTMAWQHFPLQVSPVLPGAYPVLDALEQEWRQERAQGSQKP